MAKRRYHIQFNDKQFPFPAARQCQGMLFLGNSLNIHTVTFWDERLRTVGYLVKKYAPHLMTR